MTTEFKDALDWRDVPGYPLYRASSCGHIKNVLTNKILKPTKCSSGYMSVSLCHSGIIKFQRVHRIVARAFLGISDLHVDHINCDRTDNRIENLQYVTKAENTRLNATRKTDRTKLIGAYLRKWRGQKTCKPWLAKGYRDGKEIRLGMFATEQEAHEAYLKFRREIDNADGLSIDRNKDSVLLS